MNGRGVHHLPNLIGWRVLGRQGELGLVVDAHHPAEAPDSSTIVIRGGVSDALRYHVPATRLVSISPVTRTVKVDVDVADFVPSFGDGGTVELRLSS